MKDKYGTEIVVGSRVAQWGIPFQSDDWIYGEVTALKCEPKDLVNGNGDEDVMVKFDDIEYDTEDEKRPLGESACSDRLIVCEDDEGEHDVVLTFTVTAKSKNEAYDRVQRWMNKKMHRAGDLPDGACGTELRLAKP